MIVTFDGNDVGFTLSLSVPIPANISITRVESVGVFVKTGVSWLMGSGEAVCCDVWVGGEGRRGGQILHRPQKCRARMAQ